MKNKKLSNRYIILGIVFVLIVGGYIYSSSAPKLSPEEYIKKSLAEDYGYEVIDLGKLSNNEVFVKLRTFGEKEEQVRYSVLTLSVWYPDSDKYNIQIIFSGTDCYYGIDGKEYRTNFDNMKKNLDNRNEDEAIRFSHNIDNMIINSEVCY